MSKSKFRVRTMDIERTIRLTSRYGSDNAACGTMLATKVSEAIEDISKIVLEQGQKLNVLILIVRPNLALRARHMSCHDKKWYNTSIKDNEWEFLSPDSEPACVSIDILNAVPAYKATRVLSNMDTLDSEDATILEWLPRRKLKAFLKSYVDLLYTPMEKIVLRPAYDA